MDWSPVILGIWSSASGHASLEAVYHQWDQWIDGGTIWVVVFLHIMFHITFLLPISYFIQSQVFESVINTPLSISSGTMQEGKKSICAVGKLSLIFLKLKTSTIIVDLFRECHIHLGFSLILKLEPWTRWPLEGLRDDIYQGHLESQSPHPLRNGAWFLNDYERLKSMLLSWILTNTLNCPG